MLPDSHAHIDMIQKDPREVVTSAYRAGVSPLITIGINIPSSREAVLLASRHEGVFASVGIHPNDSSNTGEEEMKELRRLAESSDRVVAIGETGLDYYRDSSPPESQKRALRLQIRLAKELNRALVIHDREAHADVLDILGEEKAGEVPVIFHCFSGDGALLEECAERGYYISFAGPITFKKAEQARRMAALAPLDRLLVETDSPFLSPVPFRGKPNLPERVRLVAERLAEIRSLPLEEMTGVLRENTFRAFGLEPGAAGFKPGGG